MMALTDASRHDWLEGRGPTLTLLAFRTTPPVRSSPLTSNSKPKILSLSPRSARHDHHSRHSLSLYRDRHSIFQRNDPHWTLAEQLAGKQSPTQLGRALEELGIQQIPAYSPRPKAASSAPGALVRTVWSANFASPVPPLCPKPTPCSPASAPITTSASPGPRRCRARLPLPAPPLRSRPLPQLALSTRRRRRSHRHPRRELHRPAALARPSRLCRRNRRTCASSGRQSARLSRRPASAHAASAARRTCRSPPQAPDLGAEKEKTDASHLQSLRPPGFSGRYLIDRGDTVSLQLIRHFLVATTGAQLRLIENLISLGHSVEPLSIANALKTEGVSSERRAELSYWEAEAQRLLDDTITL